MGSSSTTYRICPVILGYRVYGNGKHRRTSDYVYSAIDKSENGGLVT